MADTDTTTEDLRPGSFRWDGRPSRRPLQVAGTDQLIRHPDTDPMVATVDGQEVDVPDVVDIDDPVLAGRMRGDANWAEVDTGDLFAQELQAVDGVSAELASKVADEIDRDQLLADIAAGDNRHAVAALQKVDGIGKATATAIVDLFDPDEPTTPDTGDDTEES